MTEELKKYLQQLADKYEIVTFYDEDPSQFLKWYREPEGTDFSSAQSSSDSTIANIECASFIAAMLAFGNRKQFIPKIREILTLADKTSGSITKWLLSGRQNFPTGEKKFYRFYSYDDMHDLFEEMAKILRDSDSMGTYFKKLWLSELNKASTLENTQANMSKQESAAIPAAGHCGQSKKVNCPLEGVAEDRAAGWSQGQAPLLDTLFAQAFPKSSIVPKGKTSANKRIHMFLRWMCRQNSPVDLGIWNWYPQSLLLIPLDVHVMQEGTKLGLLPEKCNASRKTAVTLTKEMEQAFPGDPARADFALFGLGVDSEN